jgi:hypothetical protein
MKNYFSVACCVALVGAVACGDDSGGSGTGGGGTGGNGTTATTGSTSGSTSASTSASTTTVGGTGGAGGEGTGGEGTGGEPGAGGTGGNGSGGGEAAACEAACTDPDPIGIAESEFLDEACAQCFQPTLGGACAAAGEACIDDDVDGKDCFSCLSWAKGGVSAVELCEDSYPLAEALAECFCTECG